MDGRKEGREGKEGKRREGKEMGKGRHIGINDFTYSRTQESKIYH